MTSPGGASGITPPNGAVTGNDGSTTAMAQQTQDAVVAQKSAELKASDSWGGASNTFFGSILAGFANLGAVLSGIADAFDGTYSGSNSGLGRIKSRSDAQAAAQITLENRVESLLSGGVRSTYMLSGTFPDPGPGKTVCVAVLRGGQGGGRDSSTQNPGGIGSPYVYQEFASEELTYPVTVTVGSGGAGRTSGTGTGSAGLTSSFGTYLVVTPSTSQGGIISAQGIVASAGDAGNGGLAELSDFTPGSSGTGNALCAGGLYGSSTVPGQPGAACPTDGLAVAGGGGGAGSAWAVSGANGGAGGWPGGGGGSGVNAGGAGASGAVFVTVKG